MKNIAGSVLTGKRKGYVPAGVRAVFADMYWNESGARKLSYPEVIKIGGIDYKVSLVDACDEDDLNIDGKINFPTQEIRIKKGLEKQYEESILLHEVIHGIFEFCGWEQNEENVTRLSNALYQVLRDNNIFK